MRGRLPGIIGAMLIIGVIVWVFLNRGDSQTSTDASQSASSVPTGSSSATPDSALLLQDDIRRTQQTKLIKDFERAYWSYSAGESPKSYRLRVEVYAKDPRSIEWKNAFISSGYAAEVSMVGEPNAELTFPEDNLWYVTVQSMKVLRDPATHSLIVDTATGQPIVYRLRHEFYITQHEGRWVVVSDEVASNG